MFTLSFYLIKILNIYQYLQFWRSSVCTVLSHSIDSITFLGSVFVKAKVLRSWFIVNLISVSFKNIIGAQV